MRQPGRFWAIGYGDGLDAGGVLDFWLGWSTKTSMANHYDRSREDVEFRRAVAQSAGYGFQLSVPIGTKEQTSRNPENPEAIKMQEVASIRKISAAA